MRDSGRMGPVLYQKGAARHVILLKIKSRESPARRAARKPGKVVWRNGIFRLGNEFFNAVSKNKRLLLFIREFS